MPSTLLMIAGRPTSVLIMFSIACRKGKRVSNPVQEEAVIR